jgi:hypothetical protein
VSILDTCTESDIKENNKCGIIYTIAKLNSDMIMEVTLDAMIGLLYGRHFRKCAFTKRRKFTLMMVPRGDLEGPDFPLPDINKTLKKVNEVSDKFSHQAYLRAVKATCFSPTRRSVPDYKQGPRLVALHFQVKTVKCGVHNIFNLNVFGQERIRNLVFTMLDKQLKEHDLFYLEYHMVQLILPCFVASFLDLQKVKMATAAQKEAYMQFIHELIRSYERCPFPQHKKLIESIFFYIPPERLREKIILDVQLIMSQLRCHIGANSVTTQLYNKCFRLVVLSRAT